ncbi:MAG: DNA polymerase I [Magnetococcales bacterium]|nr:DNA polymerase I [Magnetococcales bacterium]
MTTPRMFLIDGSGYLYRAFHGVRNLARRDGFPTNAIFGFIKMVRKVVDEESPDYLAIAFDARGPTFRHELDDRYKANRPPMPDALRVQVPIIHQVVEAYRIPLFVKPGFEADDLLGTLATAGEAAGLEVVLVTGDKDFMQLVTERVILLDTLKEAWIRIPEVEARWGVPPARVTQVMGLAGDSSDNIPGVPGIGPKTAAELIREFGDLETLLANTARIRQPVRRRSLESFGEQALLSRRLATIDRAVGFDFTLEGLRRQPPDRERLRALFREMEFHSLLRELSEGPLPSPPPAREVEGGATVGEAVVGDAAAGDAVAGDAAAGDAVVVGPVAAPVACHCEILTTPEALQAFLERLRRQPAFSLDTETTGTDPVRAELVGLSFAWEPLHAVYIPVAHTPEAAPGGQLPVAMVLAALGPILEDPTVAKVGQNIKYDYVVLRRLGIRLAGITDDTMLQSHLLYGGGRRHNLDAIAQAELGRRTITFAEVAGSGRQQRLFSEVPLEKAAPYACEDAEVTWAAAATMAPRLAALGEVASLYAEVECPLIPVLGEMELHGITIDRAALEAMSVDFTARREALVREIHELAGEPFNVNSTQQLGAILFDKLGIKGGRKTKTGHSTDVTVLTRLAAQGHLLPARVLTYRGLTKLQSTYTEALVAMIHPQTGRVHTSYNQAVTLTGRLSSSEPNLQNIPIRTEEGRAIRAAFVAPPGRLLLAADYSQIELRLLAHLGAVRGLEEAFRRDEDIHTVTASELFGFSPEQVTPEARRMAKTINFGLIYGMSPFGLASRLGIGLAEARRYMERYFARYGGVREYMEVTVATARRQGFVTTLGGRRCRVADIDSPNRTLRELAERTAINAPIQGSAADLIKKAMIRLAAELEKRRLAARMVMQVHDELVLELPESELAAVASLVREVMEGAVSLAVPLKVEVGHGRNWAEAH